MTNKLIANDDSEAYYEGYDAGYESKPFHCPYEVDTQEYLDWQLGFEEGAFFYYSFYYFNFCLNDRSGKN